MEFYDLISWLQGAFFEHLLLPILHWAGFSHWADEAYDAVAYSLLGFAFIGITYLVLRPLEAWIPVERWHNRDQVRVDVLYTFLEKLGFIPLFAFLLLEPLGRWVNSWLHWHGWLPVQLEDWFPALQSQFLLSFLVYIVAIDFFEYWRHRLQHRLQWWWGLHCIHHSQRYMSFWTDSRNHLLDSVIQAVWLAGIAQLIGVPGNQFLFMILVFQIIESLSHVNARIYFGRIGERLIVSPGFHRQHHGMGVGHQGKVGGCNFATLLPVWDILFGTARFERNLPQTGILDQLQGVNYGESFWQQQLVGFKRMLGRT